MFQPPFLLVIPKQSLSINIQKCLYTCKSVLHSLQWVKKQIFLSILCKKVKYFKEILGYDSEYTKWGYLKKSCDDWEADKWHHLHISIREFRWDEDLLELAGSNGCKENHIWLHHIPHLLGKVQQRNVCSFLLCWESLEGSALMFAWFGLGFFVHF